MRSGSFVLATSSATVSIGHASSYSDATSVCAAPSKTSAVARRSGSFVLAT